MGVFEDSVNTFLAPIKEYLADVKVSEILVNGPFEIFIEKEGILNRTDSRFKDEQALQAAVRNIAQFVGRQVDAEHPILEARLPDGSRIEAVFPPCARNGTTLSIRKFSKSKIGFIDLIDRGSITKDAARFLDTAVYLAKNIIVSGGTGSGKTTFLSVLGGRIPKAQRLLVIEDASELKIETDHMVSFETLGDVTIRDLLKASLRLRPDRIVVGEVRGPEALDLVNAMNTGHGGSMGTTHANSPIDALSRLETLSLMGTAQVPPEVIRRQICSAINIIVQVKRLDDGSRKVSEITEVVPFLDDRGRYLVRDIFTYVQRGRTPEKKIVGELIPTGTLPSFIKEIEVNKIPIGANTFKPPEWYNQKKSA